MDILDEWISVATAPDDDLIDTYAKGYALCNKRVFGVALKLMIVTYCHATKKAK